MKPVVAEFLVSPTDDGEGLWLHCPARLCTRPGWQQFVEGVASVGSLTALARAHAKQPHRDSASQRGEARRLGLT